MLFDILKKFIENSVNILFFTIGAVIIFVIFKLIFNFIEYILFKKIIAALVDEIFDENENKFNQKLPNSNQEDEILEEKNKDKEKIIEIEKINQRNQEVKTNFQKRIVGITQKKIFGKWTKMIVGRFAQKIANLDLSELQNLGQFQAQEKARERSRQINQDKNKNNDFARDM